MKRSYLFVGLLGATLAACTTSTPVTTGVAPSAATAPAPAGLTALGYAYDAKLAVGTAWLAYLDSGKASPAVVAKIDPLYRAASAALASWSTAVAAGTATTSDQAAVTTAYDALTAAMASYGIATTTPAS